jgi:uncharacterized membrane protein
MSTPKVTQRTSPATRAGQSEAGGLRTITPRSMGWVPFITLVISVLGLLDSGYQTYTHFTGTGLLGCSASSDPCVAVQSSQYAWILGIPVAALGLAFYVFMVAICSPPAWHTTRVVVHWARVAAISVGMLFVLYLVYTEIIRIGRICPYCTSVHIITFVLFLLIMSKAPSLSHQETPETEKKPQTRKKPQRAR